MIQLYSARTSDGLELYSEHIQKCLKIFDKIFPVFSNSLIRVFEYRGEIERLESCIRMMIKYHDIGKLTYKWQQNLVQKDKNHLDNNQTNASTKFTAKLPAHAPLGAAYLWMTLPEDMKNPLAFAVCIHHTDQGLLSENIEKPDVRAILDGIVSFDGKIKWDDEVYKKGEFIPDDLDEKVTIDSLREMALNLRVWSRGCSILEQHRRRLMVSFAHHILKICDISAAIERAEFKNMGDLYGGWRMVDEIRRYAISLEKRGRG